MKFRVWILLAAGLLVVGDGATAAQNTITGTGDFRDALWGQTPAEVQRQESAPPFYRDDHLVIYRGEFQDTPADVIYYFLNDKLVMGFVHLLLDHEDLAAYFDDYEAVKSALGRQVGVPDAENWQMSLPELEEDHSLWGDALGFGLIKVEAGWLLGDSGLALRLSGGNLQGQLMLVQFSRQDMNAGRAAYRDYFAQMIGVPNKYFRN